MYLLASLIYYPYVQEHTVSYAVFRLLGSTGILLTVYAISRRRTLLIHRSPRASNAAWATGW